jgi:hypothetical protein
MANNSYFFENLIQSCEVGLTAALHNAGLGQGWDYEPGIKKSKKLNFFSLFNQDLRILVDGEKWFTVKRASPLLYMFAADPVSVKAIN